MLGILILLVIISVISKYAMKRLRNFAGGINAPRDIRQEKSLAERLFMGVYGVVSPVGNPEENLSTIFSVGRKDARTEGTATVFRATAGWRYGYIVVMCLVIAFVVNLEMSPAYAGQTPMLIYLAFGGSLIWSGFYIWNFRLAIDGIDMECTGKLLNTRYFDLTRLIRAETTRDGYTLHFDDHRSISMPRFLEGHDLLKDFLIGQLEDNGY